MCFCCVRVTPLDDTEPHAQPWWVASGSASKHSDAGSNAYHSGRPYALVSNAFFWYTACQLKVFDRLRLLVTSKPNDRSRSNTLGGFTTQSARSSNITVDSSTSTSGCEMRCGADKYAEVECGCSTQVAVRALRRKNLR